MRRAQVRPTDAGGPPVPPVAPAAPVLRVSRRMVSNQRSVRANYELGGALCFVAGAANVAGFIAVHQFTSHMTGLVTSLAANLIAQDWAVVGVCAAGIASFFVGAMTSTVLVNYARLKRLRSHFVWPLLLEALLLLGVGLIGPHHDTAAAFPLLLVATLCGLMGLQNALVSKLSDAEVRTTHVTGMMTDLGIEVARWLCAYTPLRQGLRDVDRSRMVALAWLVGCFFVGALCGAFAFIHIGFDLFVVLSGALILLTSGVLLDGVRARTGEE